MPRRAHRGAWVTRRRVDDVSDRPTVIPNDDAFTGEWRRADAELLRAPAAVLAVREQDHPGRPREVAPHGLASGAILPTTFPTTWGANQGDARRRTEGTLPCFVEREKGLEPSTSTLARWHSTTELLPQVVSELLGTSRISSLTVHRCQACFRLVRTPVRTLGLFPPKIGTSLPTAETAARFSSRSTDE